MIEEDFTGRTYDNIKALHSLVVRLLEMLGPYELDQENSIVTDKMSEFFKARGRSSLAQQKVLPQIECRETLLALGTPPKNYNGY